jgi:hypothetical protein
MRVSLVYWLILIDLLAISCTPKYLSEEDLKKYVLNSENGLTKELTVDDFRISATYRPTDLWVAQELGSSTDSTQIEKLKEKYGSHYYFVLGLSKNGREAIQAATMPQMQFSELLQIISFRMDSYVNMTTAQLDTIPLAAFTYTRSFGLGGSNDILLVFDKKKTEKQDWVQINLAEFGLGLGRQSMRFKCQDLEIAPKIDFKNLQ